MLLLVILCTSMLFAHAYHVPSLTKRSFNLINKSKIMKQTSLFFEPVGSDNSIDVTSFKGEDAANFVLEQQDADKWKKFTAAVAVVLSFIFYVWIYNGGPQWGLQYKDYMESISNGDSTTVIVLMLGFFAVCHS